MIWRIARSQMSTSKKPRNGAMTVVPRPMKMMRIVPIDWSTMRAAKMRAGVTIHLKKVLSKIALQSIGVSSPASAAAPGVRPCERRRPAEGLNIPHAAGGAQSRICPPAPRGARGAAQKRPLHPPVKGLHFNDCTRNRSTARGGRGMTQIRNFSIIAHIDHGKSTLADRFIQRAKLVEDREFHDQMLDNMDIERERGITIKSQTVCLPYTSAAGEQYILNLIDTPGHVDFSYEVSRALASCEGVLLLVDATQGVQAQTLANLYAALEHELAIIPVINKIDSPSADIEHTRRRDRDGARARRGATRFSARPRRAPASTRFSRRSSLRIPPPKGDRDAPLAALIFDAKYDPFRGAIISCRVFDGTLRTGDDDTPHVARHDAPRRGGRRVPHRARAATRALTRGRSVTSIAGIKTVSDTRIGDTITLDDDPVAAPLPGFREVKPVVFSSVYPVSSGGFRRALRLAGALQAERRLPRVSEGLVDGARAGIPVRISRAPPPRDLPGAARARVRPVDHHDRAERRVPLRPQGRRDGRRRQSPATIPTRSRSTTRSSRTSGRRSSCRTATSAP